LNYAILPHLRLTLIRIKRQTEEMKQRNKAFNDLFSWQFPKSDESYINCRITYSFVWQNVYYFRWSNFLTIDSHWLYSSIYKLLYTSEKHFFLLTFRIYLQLGHDRIFPSLKQRSEIKYSRSRRIGNVWLKATNKKILIFLLIYNL